MLHIYILHVCTCIFEMFEIKVLFCANVRCTGSLNGAAGSLYVRFSFHTDSNMLVVKI